MKKIVSLLLVALITLGSIGQITTTKVSPATSKIDESPYDSSENFVGKSVNKYLTQELYLTGKSKVLRNYGYDGFTTDYRKSKFDKGSVYKCCDGYNSRYDDLNGRYFKVLQVINHPKASENESLYGDKFYLKLEEKESKDIVYFEYSSKSAFPFIVVGFFEKKKRLLLGQEFIFTDRILKVSTGGGLDITTGNPLKANTGERWKCIDLTIEERYYDLALVVVSPSGEKTTISYESIFDMDNNAFTPTQVDRYISEFGPDKFNKILQGKVSIGMTKEMCILSWGKPNTINETITAGKKSEQWVYKDNYLYFDNGVLTTIQ